MDVMQGDLRSCLTAAMAGMFDLLVRPWSQLCALHPAALYSCPAWPCRSSIRLTCPHLRMRSLGAILQQLGPAGIAGAGCWTACSLS